MEEDVIASVRRVLEQFFSNIDDVKESEKKWYNCKTAVKHTLSSLRKHPKIIFNSDENNRATPSDFSRWLFAQLLRILCAPQCSEIHSDILKMVDTILVDYRCRSVRLYNEVLLEVVSCFLSAAQVSCLIADNALENLHQIGWVPFSGMDGLVQRKSASSISLCDETKCNTALSVTLHILNLHYQTGLPDRYLNALLKGTSQVIEICEPGLKGAALKLAGSLLLISPPDYLTEGVNVVVDLALHFLNSTQHWALVPDIVENVKRLLTIALTGCEYRKALPWRYVEDIRIPWIKVLDILDRVILMLESGSDLYKEWGVQCVCYIYTTWNVTQYEETRLNTSRDSSCHDNRTPSLIPLLVNQLPLLKPELVLHSIMTVLEATPRRLSIEKDMLLFLLPYHSTEHNLQRGSPKKKSNKTRSSVLHQVLISELDSLLLKVLETSSALLRLDSVWRCLVHSALLHPHILPLVSNKVSDVTSTVETVLSQERNTWSVCLTILSNTLLLLHCNKTTISSSVRTTAKKLLDVNIGTGSTLSDADKARVLSCYVMLGSYNENNVKLYLNPIIGSQGKWSVFPLIQLLSQMKKTKVLDCVQLLTNCKNGEILTEVAVHLDQIVLACCDGELKFTETTGVYCKDLTTCLRFSPSSSPGAEEDRLLPDKTVRNILTLYKPDNQESCLLSALDHVTMLAGYVDKQRVVDMLIPLILHSDSNIRHKLAKKGWTDLTFFSTTSSQTKSTKLTESQKKVLHNLKLSLDKSDDFKKTGLASAIAVACGAGKERLFTKELLPAIMYGVLLEEDSATQVFVMQGLEKIAECQGLNSKTELFERFNVTICDIAAKRILEQPDAIVSFLEEVSGAFFSSNKQTHKQTSPAAYLLARNIQHILPAVFHYGGQSVNHGNIAREILQTLCDFVNQTVKSLVVKHFSHIFCYIARFSKQQDSPFTFVENVSGMSLSELMQHNVQPITNQLVLYLSRDQEGVAWGLNMLQANTGAIRDNNNNQSSPHGAGRLAGLIEARLLGILASLATLQRGKFTEESYLVLESIIELLQILPPATLTKWKNKLLSILRNGLNSQDVVVRHDALKAWDTFVRVSERKCVGPLLGEIVAVLLPHINSFSNQVIQTVRYLLLERWNEIKNYVGDIGWLTLPDHSELADVNAKLQSHGRDEAGKITEEGFKERVKSHIVGVTAESSEVRAHSLSSLQQLLHSNQHIINHMVLGSETVDTVITELISTLLSGVRDPDLDIRILACTCLGEVGAIDGGLLGSVVSSATSQRKVYLEGLEDEQFGPDLLVVLSKGYRNSADQLTEDKFAFAIQEVLSAYRQCGDQLFQRFKDRFDDSVMEILEPHINSRYILNPHSEPSRASPVFRSDSNTTFEEWLSSWTSVLLQLTTEETSHKLASLLLPPLKIITSTQSDTLQFLLPILVLQILLKGSSTAVDLVLTEIQAVLYSTQNNTVLCDVTRLIAQTVFSLIDYVVIWINKKRSRSVKGNSESAALLARVESTLNKISKQVIAVSAFNCGAYNRALMYLEYKNKITDQRDWELLQRIYVKMSEFDGVAGVTASRKTPASLREQIQALETEGRLLETPPMYEQGLTQFPKDNFFIQGHLKQLLHRGLHTTLLGFVSNRIQEDSSLTEDLNEYRVQAAWSLARWDLVEEYLSSTPDNTSWSVGVGKQFLSARLLDKDTFNTSLRALRAEQLIPLSVAVMEGGCYERCYENVLNLHMLRDVEEWANSLLFDKDIALSETDIISKNKEFESRMGVIQDSWRTREPVLNLQRALLRLVCEGRSQQTVNSTLGTSWLNSATIARREMLIPCCDSALQNASLYSPPKFKIERARWLWDKSSKEEAMTLLGEYLSEIDNRADSITRRGKAEAKLLYANWRELSSYYSSEEIQHLFLKVTDTDPSWEEAQFNCANYYYKWSKACPALKPQMIPHVIKHYGESLKYGSKNIFQSLPRLLTTWFDLEGSDSHPSASQMSMSQVAHKPNLVLQANKHIDDLIKTLPTYQWLTALSQILSRICHPSPSVSSKLVEIASLVLYHYPEQTIWHIYSIINNSNKDRQQRGNEIIKLTINKFKQPIGERGVTWFKTFWKDFHRLCQGLLEISKKDSGNSATLSITRDFRTIKKMIEDPNYSRIILPIQQNTTVTLPVGPGPSHDHKAFPHHLVTITSLRDEVLVLNSLQRPKKITIVGSNGKTYGLLCKPKDDLRKDCRFMEFNMMVNRLLKKDAAARKKQLHIRTYAVLPLSNDSGIVEWVDNTRLLRVILQGLYSEYKKGMTKTETKNTFAKLQQIKQHTPQKQKAAEFIKLFKNTMLARHPPVLSEWFRRTFPDPSCWFTARQKYTQTTAVISMVGYVVGLGDRHAENIMFDLTTGETVHVDFDCLFEKGESFDWPEKVPFRLTHNLVDAFGVTGVEGNFRLSCVDTMRVMRNEKDSLLSVLNSFVYDPLVEWAKPDKRGYQVDRGRQNTRSEAHMKDKAQEIMRAIEKKLNGQMGKNAHAKLPISTEGQVYKLISDSTDISNLSQMYIGWAPFY